MKDDFKVIIELLEDGPKSKEELIAEIGKKSEKPATENTLRRYVTKAKAYLREMTNGTMELRVENKTYCLIKTENSDMKVVELNDLLYTPSNKKIIDKVLLLELLGEKGGKLEYKQIVSEMDERRRDITGAEDDIFAEEAENDDIRREVQHRSAQIKNRVAYLLIGKDKSSLLKEQYIQNNKKNSENGVVSEIELTTKAPVYLQVDDDYLYTVQDALQTFAQTDIASKQIKTIESELSFMKGNQDNNTSAIRKLGRKKELSPKMRTLLSRLVEEQFHKWAIHIKYFSKNKEREYYFQTGLVLYAADKNQMYLIGEQVNQPGHAMILKGEGIGEIKRVDTENKIYLSDQYQKMYREMFSVSVEKPIDVEVQFDDVFSIREKLERLVRVRGGSIKDRHEGDKRYFIYADTIRGMDDFAKYIRTFGSGAKVLSPPALRKRMYDTADGVLQAYNAFL